MPRNCRILSLVEIAPRLLPLFYHLSMSPQGEGDGSIDMARKHPGYVYRVVLKATTALLVCLTLSDFARPLSTGARRPFACLPTETSNKTFPGMNAFRSVKTGNMMQLPSQLSGMV